MPTVRSLLEKFNLDLDLPDFILKLSFDGNYTKCVLRNDDPDYPEDIWYEIVDEKNLSVISISLPDQDEASLIYTGDYGLDFVCGGYEEYFYDDENHFSFADC